jgi:hypothetical protein
LPNIEIFYIRRIYLLLIESSLCSSLDPLFHSDSIIHHKLSQRKINECISILLSEIDKTESVLYDITYSTGSYKADSQAT